MPNRNLFFTNKLIAWYIKNGRELPWRKTTEPYFIWLSEIILQQTRVAQGMPYYLKFVDAFPNVMTLATATEDEVLKLWQGLGYYSRARNLHSTAKFVTKELDGVFPKDYAGLMQLKGVGDYTASAIASICYDEPTAVVDGNVYRVLSRFFNIALPINSTQGIKEFKSLAQTLIDKSQPGTFNQAVMEFGARHCVPQNPNCDSCIFNDRCDAFLNKKVGELPIKLKKSKVKKLYFNYIVFLSEDGRTMLNQRTEKGIWKQLYQFPLIETASEVTLESLKASLAFKNIFEEIRMKSVIPFKEQSVLHKLSHRDIYARFWIAETEALQKKGIDFLEIHNYPVPVLIENFISDFSTFNRKKKHISELYSS